MSFDDRPQLGSRVPLRRLVPVLALIGATSFGGGRFAYYHDALVEKKKWLSDQDFLEGLTISQIIPGPTFANFTVFVSQRLGGTIGALTGLLLILAPGSIAMILLSYLYGLGVTKIPLADAAFRGLGASASGLTLVTIVRLLRIRSGVPNWGTWVMAGVTFLALGPLQLNMLYVVPPLALVGLWLNRPSRQHSA